MNPPLDPRFQPCYVAETIYQMKEAGLDFSCYYHLRDYYVSFDRFEKFMSPRGTAFMTRWWNRMPQFDGLFDYQNQVRPAYFTFKLLSRLAGDRLKLTSSYPAVHGLATRDDRMLMENMLLWNFSSQPVNVTIRFDGLKENRKIRHIILDAASVSADENDRLRPAPFEELKIDQPQRQLKFEPYAIHYWSFE
jgi:xylan 1,4-beta-xylosidase